MEIKPYETVQGFSEWAKSVWFSHPGVDGNEMTDRDLTIMGFGLCGEAGEVAEKMKKHVRDGTLDKEAILKELGDVVFYAITIARYYGFTFRDILKANYDKLTGRRERGTERGSGDNR